MANFEFKRLNINMAKYKARRDKKRRYARYSAYVLSVFVLVFLSVTTITNSKTISMTAKRFLAGLGVYTEEVNSVDIMSDNYDGEGEWHINKSAKWLSGDTAEVTLNVDSILKKSNNKYKDIILVIDTSGSMIGDRIDKVKEDSTDLVEYMLSRTGNKVALITFNNHSTIQSDFTGDKDEILDKIDAITVGGNTNYNEPLQNVDEILEDYSHSNDRDTVVLFLTDGSPNEDTPRQVGTYSMLKDKYPYLIVSGIQYEMGNSILPELIQVSDEQYISDMQTLKDVLFEAAARPLKYDRFVIEDVIDNDSFSVLSASDIEVSKGTATLDETGANQKVVWNMNEIYQTGGKAKMTVKLKLKNSYVTTKGYYGTNDSLSVDFKLEDYEDTVTSTSTPVLKNYYTIRYDTNTPSGCSLSNIASEEHFIFTNVTKKTNELSCNGYLYKGFEIDDDDDDVKLINDNVFVMPVHDVQIRATWTKLSINKSVDGTVYGKTTLYKVLEDEAKKGNYVKKYTGEHQDSFVVDDGSLTPSEVDVTPADVSVINTSSSYPFTYNEDTQQWTNTNQNNHSTTSSIKFKVNIDNINQLKIHYKVSSESGWDYLTIFVDGQQVLQQSGEQESDFLLEDFDEDSEIEVTYSKDSSASSGADTAYFSFVKAYTTSGNSSRIYYFYDYNGNSDKILAEKNNVIFANHCWKMIRTTDTGGIKMLYNGEVEDNKCLDTRSSHVGYEITSTTQLYDSYYYGTDYQYDSVQKKFSLSGTVTTGDIKLNQYTCKSSSTDGTCSTLYYVDSLNNDGTYDILQLGTNASNNSLGKLQYNRNTNSMSYVGYMYNTVYPTKSVNNSTYGITERPVLPIARSEYDDDSIVNNTTYPFMYDETNNYWYSTMKEHNNSASIKFKVKTAGDYVINYTVSSESNYDKAYFYKNGTQLAVDSGSNTATIALNGLTTTDEIEVKYSKDSSVSKGNDNVIFNIGQLSSEGVDNRYLFGNDVEYINGAYKLVDAIRASKNDSFVNNHYTCFSTSDICETVNYIYGQSGSTVYYIELTGGTNIQGAVDKMLYSNDVNTTDSTIKKGIDLWYKNNLLDYSDFIEDNIYCNDRSQYNSNTNGWNPNGGSLTTNMYFARGSYGASDHSIKCKNITDSFSTLNNKAKLNYKIGLMSYNELYWTGSGADAIGTINMWNMDPDSYDKTQARVRFYSGSTTVDGSTNVPLVRPAISLAPGIEYIAGNGTMKHPYRIKETIDD